MGPKTPPSICQSYVLVNGRFNGGICSANGPQRPSIRQIESASACRYCERRRATRRCAHASCVGGDASTFLVASDRGHRPGVRRVEPTASHRARRRVNPWQWDVSGTGHSGRGQLSRFHIMTQQQSPDDNARAPIDRTRTSRGEAASAWCCSIALVLIGAAGGLLFIGRAKAEPYILALARRAGHGRRVPGCSRSPPAFCARPAREAASPLLKARGRRRQRGHPGHRRERARALRQRAPISAWSRRPVRRTCARSSASSSAIPACRKRSIACSRRRAKAAAAGGGARRRACAARRRAGCASACARSAKASADPA